jgi:Domain of unknown function (DUF5667)
MKRLRSFFIACALYCSYAFAGHGLMNSFGGIEWLPEAGLDPASPLYPLDTWREQAELWQATSPARTIALCERFAREKLAELEVMIRAEDRPAAEIAIVQYRGYLNGARAALLEITSTDRDKVAFTFATTLLEHQYIISTDYLDLPRESRLVAMTMLEVAGMLYAELRTQLSRRVQDSLFFKEEEVRWSRDQAAGADAQGL